VISSSLLATGSKRLACDVRIEDLDSSFITLALCTQSLLREIHKNKKGFNISQTAVALIMNRLYKALIGYLSLSETL